MTSSTLSFVSQHVVPVVVHAYITSHGALPPHRQRQFLKDMTHNLCNVRPGCLSKREIHQAEELMYAWSHTPYKITKENALAVERLVKRLVDEQRACQQTNHKKNYQYDNNNNNNDDNKNNNNNGQEHQQEFILTVDDYNCLLEGWARASADIGVAAAERCEQILFAMQDNYDQQRQQQQQQNQLCSCPQPNVESFKIVLQAWKHVANGNSSSSSNKQQQQQRRGSDGGVVDFAPLRAQRVLELMIRSYQHSAAAHVDAQQPSAVAPMSAILPDADCFDTVLQLWSRSGLPQAPYVAEQLLGVMERLYFQTMDPSVKPRTLSFNAVLAAWAKSTTTTTHSTQAAAQQQQQYQRQQRQQQQQQQTQNGGADSTIATTSAMAAATRACDILTFMELLGRAGDDTVAPDNASYCTVMGALAHSGVDNAHEAALKAEEFLMHIKEQMDTRVSATTTAATATTTEGSNSVKNNHQHSSSSPGKVVPDTILFNTAMGLWAKAQVPGAYKKARAILDYQVSLYQAGWRKCQPDVYGFTSVIASCAAEPAASSKHQKRQAFDVALQTFQDLQAYKHDHVNHVTYGAMFKACGKLLPPASAIRTKMVQTLFEQCIQDGYASDLVIARVREATLGHPRGEEFLHQGLLKGHSRKHLPQDWTRNVPEHMLHGGGGNNNNHHQHHHGWSKQQRNHHQKRRSAEV